MIDVLVVEDSRVIRDYLVYVIQTDPDLRVMETVGSGEAALEFLNHRRPDVILMDIHMPGINGIETTRRIMSRLPVPIVVYMGSAHFDEVHTALRAMEAGALAVLKKPDGVGSPRAEAECAAVINALKLMSEVKVVRRWDQGGAAAAPAAPMVDGPDSPDGDDAAVVAIGASTGGPQVILQLLSGLSTAFPAPILVVQHIAVGFTDGFAAWLDGGCGLSVHVARGGETPLPGHVYVAPDDRHLVLGARGDLLTNRDEPVNGLRPSVGVLFRSVAEHLGRRAIGVILTGMGRDGAAELKLMADRGALTIAQDEASCVVFGMPGEAVKLGAARFVLLPERIHDLLLAVDGKRHTVGARREP